MNASNIKILLKHAMIADDSVLINGNHGIGKTSVVKQFAKEQKMHLETLILSLKDPSDLLGMPGVDESGLNARTIWREPDWFQRIVDKAWPIEFTLDDLEFNDLEFKKYVLSSIDKLDKTTDKFNRNELNKLYSLYYNIDKTILHLTSNQSNISCKLSQSSVLFLDELNRAFLDTRQVALQLVLEKELHSHKLPFVNGTRTFVISAINPSDLYQTDDLDMALLDRFLCIDMTIDTTDWLVYAGIVDISDVIRSFISENPDKLHYMPKNLSNGSTPRSWEKLSDILKTDIQSNVVLDGIISGKLGKDVGSLFYVYYKNYKSIIKIEDIVEFVFNIKDKSIINISSELKVYTEKIETIRKQDLLNQLISLAKEELKSENYNILSLALLCFLSSMNFEISILFCKQLKSTNTELYNYLVTLDNTINNKKFFIELIKYSRI